MAGQVLKLPERIAKFTQPRLPQFLFEWHPKAEKVYVIRIGVVPAVGEVIGFHIKDHGQASNCVLTWCRGYLTRDVEIRGDPHHNPSLVE